MAESELVEDGCDSIGVLDIGLAPLAHILSFLEIKDLCRATEVCYRKGFEPWSLGGLRILQKEIQML